jgi:hypothetical protein
MPHLTDSDSDAVTLRREDYWLRSLDRIEGWLDMRHYWMLRLIDEVQRASGVVGHIGEIGVYHGKFLLGLAHFAGPGTKVAAIDVFDDQSKNLDGAGAGNLDRLRANVAEFGPPGVDYAYLKADSIALTATDKADIMREHGPFRLFSVDGCHTAEHTYNDLLTAQDFMAPGGVVILDDYMQPHWPRRDRGGLSLVHKDDSADAAVPLLPSQAVFRRRGLASAIP